MGSLSQKWDLAYAAFKGKIRTFARNSYHCVPGYTVEDMEQELLEVLWWCTADYHPRNGATFNTFFQCSAHNRISSLIRLHSTQKRKAEIVSLDDDDLRATIESVFESESAEAAVLRRISIREYVAAEGLYGLQQLVRQEGIGALLKDDDEAV